MAETDPLHAMLESGGAGAVDSAGRDDIDDSPGCRVVGLRLRRQANSRLVDFVSDSLSSSHTVDHVHTRSVGCAHVVHDVNSLVDLHDARTNSCWDTHAARVNSLGLNSGAHVNSDRCTYNSCGGVRGGTKPVSMSTRCQDRRPAGEKHASSQQAPGRLYVETWAGRVGNLSLPISQAVEIVPRCADMVTRLPPPFFSSVSRWAGQRGSERDWLDIFGENS